MKMRDCPSGCGTVDMYAVMMFSCSALCQERCAWKHVVPASAMVACTHIHA